MAINKRVARIPIGLREVRYIVRVEGDPCEPGTQEAKVAQSLLWNAIQDPQLINPHPTGWQKLSIKHNGRGWLAEATADVAEDTER